MGAFAATPVWLTLGVFSLNHFVELQQHHVLVERMRQGSDKDAKSAKPEPRQAPKRQDRSHMQFAIRHFLPGRVRLWIPTLCYDKSLAEETLSWLRSQKAVRGARINYACSSLVVEYDLAFEPTFRLLLGGCD